MVKKIRINGVSRVVNQIGKFPPRRTQKDFPEIPNEGMYKHLIRINGRMPFKRPKIS